MAQLWLTLLQASLLLGNAFQDSREALSYMTSAVLSGPSVANGIMVLNARSVAKPDVCTALYADLKSKNVDVCCISEIWLTDAHMDHLICPQGFTILHKDTKNRAGSKCTTLLEENQCGKKLGEICRQYGLSLS